MQARHPALTGLLLIAPLPALLLLAYVLPFLGVVGWSVTLPEPGLSQYARLFSDPLTLSVLARTFRVCALVTLLATAAAYAISYVWVCGTPLQRRLAQLCILIPFWISVLTRAYGWLALLSSRGLVNTWLQQLGILEEPLTLVRNEFGVIVGMVHFLIPFAVFPIASAMRAVDGRVLLAARGLAAGPVRIFWRIFVPMTLPGIIGAALLVFVFALGFFITPAILGGGHSIMVAELVYLHMFQSPDWGLGAAISVALVAVVALLLALLWRFALPAGLRASR